MGGGQELGAGRVLGGEVREIHGLCFLSGIC